jgi:NitT/TauT family transport system ATP-binding protein
LEIQPATSRRGVTSEWYFGSLRLLKWRRILDNVMLPAEILHIPRAQARERAQYLLALVGLAGSGDRYPYELSGGMQQRVAIAAR